MMARGCLEICAELAPFTEVSIEKDCAILCAVGDRIRETPGVAARVLGALKCVNVRMISQGASLLNLGVGRRFQRSATGGGRGAPRVFHRARPCRLRLIRPSASVI